MSRSCTTTTALSAWLVGVLRSASVAIIVYLPADNFLAQSGHFHCRCSARQPSSSWHGAVCASAQTRVPRLVQIVARRVAAVRPVSFSEQSASARPREVCGVDTASLSVGGGNSEHQGTQVVVVVGRRRRREGGGLRTARSFLRSSLHCPSFYRRDRNSVNTSFCFLFFVFSGMCACVHARMYVCVCACVRAH